MTIHIGKGSGRGSGRVGSDFLSAIAGRVGSCQRFGGSDRVGSKKSDPWTTLYELDVSRGSGSFQMCLSDDPTIISLNIV